MSSSTLISNVGLSSSENRINQLKCIARANSKNDTAFINFNKYGTKDNIGLTPASDYFIDSAIIRHIPEAAFTEDDLSAASTRLCVLIKGVCSSNDFTLTRLTYAPSQKKYDWHLSLPTLGMDDILLLLSSDRFNEQFSVHSIDVTRDFAGSFDLMETLSYFETHHDLHCDYNPDAPFYEADMIKKTGTNCFIFKDKGIRYKAYLKFPQMLQNRKVRTDLGHRWYDWTQCAKNRSNSKLAQTRNATKDRGMTRIEVTVPHLMVKGVLTNLIDSFARMFSPTIIYSTPHHLMWRSFCDNLRHTLIVCDENFGDGLAIVVYGFNSLTKDIIGFTVKEWSKWCLHIMDRYTLAAHLPIDMITVSPIRRRIQNGIKCVDLELTGITYEKSIPINNKDFTCITDHKFTRITHKPPISQEDMDHFGFTAHPNIHLHIPSKRLVVKSKRLAVFDRVGDFIPVTPEFSHTTNELKYNLSIIPSHSPPMLSTATYECLPLYPTQKILDLEVGHYDIYAIIIHNTAQFHNLLINRGGEYALLYGTQNITTAITSSALPLSSSLFAQPNRPLGRLTIKYHYTSPSKCKCTAHNVTIF